MGARIIDGKNISSQMRQRIMVDAKVLKESKGVMPGLAVVLVGDDDASQVYVSMKEKACINVGFHSEVYRLPKDTSEDELLTLIDQLNNHHKIHGILVQSPLPHHLDEHLINSHIHPMKDVDGFHPINSGNLLLSEPCFVPCTPKGIIALIKSTGENISGKHGVVIGRSNIVGKPAALLLLNENATVTICHSKTYNLKDHVRNADILVAAVGSPELIKGDMIKPGAIVIDAGTRKVNGKLVGDVAFDEASKIASWITPVPGGVGPMTITMLLENTLKAAKLLCE